MTCEGVRTVGLSLSYVYNTYKGQELKGGRGDRCTLENVMGVGQKNLPGSNRPIPLCCFSYVRYEPWDGYYGHSTLGLTPAVVTSP